MRQVLFDIAARLHYNYCCTKFNIGMWLSLVERLVWDQDAAGSNPVIPTMLTVEIGFKSYFNRLFYAFGQAVAFCSCPANIGEISNLPMTL